MSTNTAEADAPPTRKATSPFEREDADFIIRSRDNVDFYVFRTVLMLASTVFEDMLPLPQPLAKSTSSGDNKPVVAVSEDNHVIDTFLRVVYPLTTPQTTSLFHVREVLEAGMKYDASVVVNEMRTALTNSSFLADDPLQVFSIAYNWCFEQEARTAAAHAVAQGHLANIEVHLPALTDVTAGAYYRLMQLHRSPRHSERESNMDDRPLMSTLDSIGPFCREPPPPPQSIGGTIHSVLAPFTDPGADLVIKSRDGRKFRVHRAIVDAASPTLLGSLIAESSPDRKGVTPTYRMPENSAIVDALLRFCYPGPRPRFAAAPESATHFLGVLAAMQQYALAATDDVVHAHWAPFARREPLRFFFHAVARGLAPEAHTCAQLVACSADSAALHAFYVPEMEAVSALAYHRLLAYVRASRDAALQSVRACTWAPPADVEPPAKPSVTPRPAPRPCVGGVQCVCAERARAQTNAGSRTLPRALLQMLAARLHREPRGGVLLDDRALVDALAEAAHNAMCVPESSEYVVPSLPRVLLALAIGWWCWSLLVAFVVALAMGQIQVKCGCLKGKHVPWAEARLGDIARMVDEAVSQVKLDLSGVLE